MTSSIDALRRAQDRFAPLVSGLTADQLTTQSYDDDWTIADVASHLGSQAEIFALAVESGVTGDAPPAQDAIRAIWDRWNAKSPADQASDSVASSEALVSRLEGLSDAERDAFVVDVFGSRRGLDELAGMRIGEHNVHTWDIAVALDPATPLPADAVAAILPLIGGPASRGTAVDGAEPVVIATTDGHGAYRVTLDPEVGAGPVADAPADIQMPAEAFVRLVYGRLDPAHTPDGVADDGGRLDDLRQAFPGF